MSRRGLSASEQGFHILADRTHYGQRVAEIPDDQYFEVIKRFITHFLNLGIANSQIANIRLSALQTETSSEVLFATSVAISSIIDTGKFSKHELRRIREWVYDDRFIVMISIFQTLASGHIDELMAFDIPIELSDREKIHSEATMCLHIIAELMGAEYINEGPTGIDVLGVLSHRSSSGEVKDFARVRETCEVVSVSFSSVLGGSNAATRKQDPLNKPVADYTDEDFEGLEREAEASIKRSRRNREAKLNLLKQVPTKRGAIRHSFRVASEIVQTRIFDKQTRAASFIVKVLEQFHAIQASTEDQESVLQGWSMLEFIYKELFNPAGARSLLTDFKDDELTDVLEIIMTLLSDLDNGESFKRQIDLQLQDTYQGIRPDFLKGIRKAIPTIGIRELYANLTAMTEVGCRSMREYAGQLTTKLQSHWVELDSLKVKVVTLEESSMEVHDSYTELLQLKKQIVAQRESFLTSIASKRAINTSADSWFKTYDELAIPLERELKTKRNEIKFHVSEIERAQNRVVHVERLSSTIDMRDEEYRIAKELLRKYNSNEMPPNERRLADIAVDDIRLTAWGIVQDEQLDQTAASDLLRSYDEAYQAILVEYREKQTALLEEFNLPDLWMRCYEEELAEVNRQFDMYKAKISDHQQRQSHERVLEEQKKSQVEVLKKHYQVTRLSGSQSSTSSLVKAQPVDVSEALEQVAVPLADLCMNDIRHKSGGTLPYPRDQSTHVRKAWDLKDYQHRRSQEMSGKLNKVQAVHDPALARKLLAKRQRKYKIIKYVLGTLGILAGGALLGLATAASLGLVHLVWIVPAAFYVAGGCGVAGGATLCGVAKPSRAKKVASGFRSLGRWLFGSSTEPMAVAQPEPQPRAQQHVQPVVATTATVNAPPALGDQAGDQEHEENRPLVRRASCSDLRSRQQEVSRAEQVSAEQQRRAIMAQAPLERLGDQFEVQTAVPVTAEGGHQRPTKAQPEVAHSDNGANMWQGRRRANSAPPTQDHIRTEGLSF